MARTSESPGSQAWWDRQLDLIVKLGAYPPALQGATELLGAPQIDMITDSFNAAARAVALVELIEAAVAGLGDAESNPRAQAARRWIGLSPDVRGLPLKDRRVAAARKILVQGAEGPRSISVETWRRNYEDDVRRDLAWELSRGDSACQ